MTSDVATSFLRMLHGQDGVFEVRAPNCPDRKKGTFTSTHSGYFNSPEGGGKAALLLDTMLEPPGVYVTMNPVKPALLARSANKVVPKAKSTTSDSDIERRRWLCIDIDPVRPSGVSSTDAEQQMAQDAGGKVSAYLKAQGWGLGVPCWSGNGVYLLYRIDLPNDKESTELVKTVLGALGKKFTNDKVDIDLTMYNAARIIKVMGTTARKGDSLVGVEGQEDRPHRVSRFKERECVAVDVGKLKTLAATMPKVEKPAPSTRNQSNGSYSRFEHDVSGVMDYLQSKGVTVKGEKHSDGGTHLMLDRCPITDADGGSSVSVFVGADGKLAYCNRHNRGEGLTWVDLRDHLEPGYKQHAENKALAVVKKQSTAVATKPKALKPLETFDGAALDQEEIRPIRWTIKSLLCEGLTVLAGRPKTGKSIFAMNLAWAVSSGEKALGQFYARQGDILYLALEDNRRRLQERMRRIRRGAVALPNITFVESGKFPRLDKGGLKLLYDYMAEHRDCRLVIIDTWARVCPGQKGNKTLYEQDADSWEMLFKFAHQFRAAVVVLHHTRKSLGFDGDWMEELSGTSGVTGTADMVMLFQRQRGESTAVLKVGGREVDEETSWALDGDKESMTWLAIGHADRVFASEIRQEIFHCLESAAEWPKDIASALSRNENTVRSALHRMCRDGQIRKLDSGKYKVTDLGFKVKAEG